MPHVGHRWGDAKLSAVGGTEILNGASGAGARHKGVSFASLGSPDGERYVEAPRDHATMKELQLAARHAGENFFCARSPGGCGERVFPINGRRRRPHFRHPPKANCQLLTLDDELVRDIFTHKMIQCALVVWLHSLGFEAHSERYLDRRSRVDILTRPAWVLEVQLSGETEVSWLERTERYGGKVTWLFSPDTPLSSREAALERDGIVHLVRLCGLQANHSDGPRHLGTSTIEIGMRTTAVGAYSEHTKWYRLEECQFDPSLGLRAPDYILASTWLRTEREMQRKREVAVAGAAAAAAAAAAAKDASEAREEELVRRAEAERANRLAEARRRFLQESRAGRPSYAPGGPRPEPPETMPGPRPTVFTLQDLRQWERTQGIRPGANVLMEQVIARHADDYQWRTGWIDGRWLTTFTEGLVEPAWIALYLSTLAQSGRLNHLVDREIDPDRSIIGRMTLIGLIEIGSPGFEDNYHALHDFRWIGTPFEYHQPRPYTN